jgi:hypothetical protein
MRIRNVSRLFANSFDIAPNGNDTNAGTLAKPFATLHRAQQALNGKPGTVLLRGGAYHLPSTLVIYSGKFRTKNAPVVFEAYKGEKPVVIGGVKLPSYCPINRPESCAAIRNEVGFGFSCKGRLPYGHNEIFSPLYFSRVAVAQISKYFRPAGVPRANSKEPCQSRKRYAHRSEEDTPEMKLSKANGIVRRNRVRQSAQRIHL